MADFGWHEPTAANAVRSYSIRNFTFKSFVTGRSWHDAGCAMNVETDKLFAKPVHRLLRQRDRAGSLYDAYSQNIAGPFRGRGGKYLLAVSISALDPARTKALADRCSNMV